MRADALHNKRRSRVVPSTANPNQGRKRQLGVRSLRKRLPGLRLEDWSPLASVAQ
jgi:hypothetical protein